MGLTSGADQVLRVEPDKIGATKIAFQTALAGVTEHLRRISNAYQQPWAGDPISQQTADAFNLRTTGDSYSSAQAALQAYADQLQGAIDSLTESEKAYRDAEQASSAWTQER
jgi:uncharacterized protein YukE